ncbi:3'-5' exonuclease [Gilliamella sp. Occ4-3]|uniref:3'-5' exonuclease n=1 Tax=Gilliamella sp. Occ4-3 TaxID=3120254 RepID=UPI0009C098B8|nr:3'-5' exonuclease [Gilliamella apicola]
MMWWAALGIFVFIIAFFLQIFWWTPLKKRKGQSDEHLNKPLKPSKISKLKKKELIVNYQDLSKKKQFYTEPPISRDNYYRSLLAKLITDNTLILDTETTGLDEKAEIIEVSIIDLKGNVLLDTLIKPKRKIPADAINIHGITNEMVKDAPLWEDIYKEFRKIVKSADLVFIYNERYDKRLIMQTCRLSKVPSPTFKSACVMKLMAQWNGEQKRNGEYLFKSLDFIARLRKVQIEGQKHRSLTDCKTVLSIINSFLNL